MIFQYKPCLSSRLSSIRRLLLIPRRILTSLFLLGLVLPSIGYAQSDSTLADKVGINSSLKRPIQSLVEFRDLIKLSRVSNGDGAMLAYIDTSKLTPREFFHYYLLVQAHELGWLAPAMSTFGSKGQTCDQQSLKLQATFIARLSGPVWCEGEQWRAANWIYKILNSVSESEPSAFFKKLFVLIHSAGADLSALEVEAAITGKYPELTIFPPKVGGAPYKSDLQDTSKLKAYEAWDPWAVAHDPVADTVAALQFFGQKLDAALGNNQDVTYRKFGSHPQSRYLIGDELVLRGGFSISFEKSFDPPTCANCSPEETYKGLYIVVNRLTLDSLPSSVNYQALDYNDFLPKKTLTIEVGQAVILANKIALGQHISERSVRIWAATGAKLFPEKELPCDIDSRLVDFSLKQIPKSNLYSARAYDALQQRNCFRSLLTIYPDIFQSQLDTVPSTIMHRYIDVDLGGQYYQFVYAQPSIASASTYLGRELLDKWNVAVAKRLLLQVKIAQLQNSRNELGQHLRAAESLRNHFLISPSAATAGELVSIFTELNSIRNTVTGKRLLIRGSEFPESPRIAGLWFLGDAGSTQTWLLPTRVNLLAIDDSARTPQFARVWVTDPASANPTVRVQLMLQVAAHYSTIAQAKAALSQRSLQFSGVAQDIVLRSVRQTSSLDWSIESQSRISENQFLVTVQMSQAFYPVWLAQLSRRPGIPVSIDWAHLTDTDLNSLSAGPIDGNIVAAEILTKSFLLDQFKLGNKTDAPAEVTTILAGADYIGLTPSLQIAAESSIDLTTTLQHYGIGSVAEIQAYWNLADQSKINSRVAYAPSEWSFVPITFQNLSDFVAGKQVKEVRIEASVIDSGGVAIYSRIPISLSRYGLSESRQDLKLFLPAGFRIRYSSKYTTVDGVEGVGPSATTDALQVQIKL